VFIDNALDLIDNVKPARTEVETVQCFEITMRDALRFGLTSIHDAAAFPDDIAFFKRYVLLVTLLSLGIRSHYPGWLTRGVYP
jgi:predicted amidohydrolase YtcJ